MSPTSAVQASALVKTFGDARAVEWRIAPLPEAGSDLPYLMCVGLDVTHRSDNAAALELSAPH